MRRRAILYRVAAVFAVSTLLAVSVCLLRGPSSRQVEVRVMVSGGLTAAYDRLVPQFERKTSYKLNTVYGASMGTSPNAIPNRLQRDEPADVVILAAEGLDDLIKQGKVVPESRVDLALSRIGMVVRKGAKKPDISTKEALKTALSAESVKTIAYSASASGTYLSTKVFPQLGIAEHKLKRVEGERVAAVVARGEADIGFQQISELLPVPGVDFVGPLPDGAQKVTTFSAGVTVGAKEPDAGRALIRFLASPEAAPVIRDTWLEPITR